MRETDDGRSTDRRLLLCGKIFSHRAGTSPIENLLLSIILIKEEEMLRNFDWLQKPEMCWVIARGGFDTIRNRVFQGKKILIFQTIAGPRTTKHGGKTIEGKV